MTRTRIAALGMALALTACGAEKPAGDPAEEQPHGYVAGATELPEAQTTMAYATSGARSLSLLDLATEQEKQIGLSIAAQRLTEDGRFVYVDDGDRTLEIVDTGVWTVDHTDHVHYYRAPARTLGTLTLDAPITTVAGSEAHTAIGTTDGRIRVLDRRKLESGSLVEVTTIDSGNPAAMAVPYAEQLLVAQGDGRMVATESGDLAVACAAPSGWAILRGGAVIACRDSVIRVKDDNGKLTAETLDSPSGPVASGGFGYRPRSNEAAVGDRTGIWSVNASKVTLRHVPADGRELVAAASPADGDTALALDATGTLVSYDLETGRQLAESPLKATTLTLDIGRAYLAVPDSGAILEIDYHDRLRTARTLRTSQRPDLAVEVGR